MSWEPSASDMSMRHFLAFLRRVGREATVSRPDNSFSLSIKGIPDDVDTRNALETGIAVGTPVFETWWEWASEIREGDVLEHSGERYKIRGKPMRDRQAGTVTFTLTRLAA
jgi:hypothetical protein